MRYVACLLGTRKVAAPRGMLRVFFALWPDAVVRAALSQCAASHLPSVPARRCEPADLHLTLAFLGTVDALRLAELECLAAGVVAEPFLLVLDRWELWSGAAVACLTPSNGAPVLRALRQRLTTALAVAGFSVDQRRYRPHLTLTRKVAGPAVVATITPIIWPVDAFVLLASCPQSGHSSYTELGRWRLVKQTGAAMPGG